MAKGSGGQTVVKGIRQEKAAVVLVLQGEIDMGRAGQLRESLLDVLDDKPARLIVNMAAVQFMDSSGLATLVEALQLTRKNGAELRLAEVPPRVRSVFEISRLDTIFDLHDTEAEALG